MPESQKVFELGILRNARTIDSWGILRQGLNTICLVDEHEPRELYWASLEEQSRQNECVLNGNLPG